MSKLKRSPQLSKSFSPLLVAGLMVAGNFHFIPQALALGTEAGVLINNTATATYDDGAGNDFETESNTVAVTVAEVAGLTNTPAGFADSTAGTPEAGDILTYTFEVENIGNATTQLNYPQPTLENLDPVTGAVDGDGDNDFGVKIYDGPPTGGGTLLGYLQPDGTVIAPADVNAPTPTPIDIDVDPDTSLFIDVVTTPALGATAGDDLRVTFGDTGANDNSPATQNQLDDGGASNLSTGAEGGTPPANGEREASASFSVDFASDPAADPVAYVTLEKTETAYNPNTTTTSTDDTITYGLAFDVLTVDPDGNPAADLEGTPVNVEGTERNLILVSDVLPAGTELTATPTAPAGWDVVYATEADNTVPAVPGDVTTPVNWITAEPTLSDVTRVGFIYNPDSDLTNNTPDNGETLAAGTSVTGFALTIRNTDPNATSILNIAQVFGESVGDDDDNIVYDESGDDRPNNIDDAGDPPNGDPYGDYNPDDPNDDNGVPDEGGEDTGRDDNDGTNDGTGPDGEALETPLDPPEPIGDDLGILNGPNGAPEAVGPTNTNDDFTEASLGDVTGAQSFTFTNTVQSTSPDPLTDVTIEPITDIDDDGTPDISVEDLPDGSTVTIIGPDIAVPNDNIAVYTYNAATGEFDLTTPALATGGPVNLGDIAVTGDTIDYDVRVDLNITDPSAGTVADPNVYSIPLLAFADNDAGNGSGQRGYTGETTKNLTFDNLYAEYVVLEKAARILDASGTPITGFLQTGLPDIEPDQSIEYQITYTNITTDPGTGTGNVTLDAESFLVKEEGTGIFPTGSTNNWSVDNDTDGNVDTLHQSGSTATTGTIYFYAETGDGTSEPDFDTASPGTLTPNGATAEPADDATVEGYINDVGTVAPQQTGTFTFIRQLQ